MRNEYTVTEVIEIGEAQEVILGQKDDVDFDSGQRGLIPDSDLDD